MARSLHRSLGRGAFMMVEYVGIPMWKVSKHAFLRVISTIRLLYIVKHLGPLRAGA